MSIVAPVYDKSDPRQEKYAITNKQGECVSTLTNRLYPFHIPDTPEWAEERDIFGQGAMMGAGAGMFIRNPLYVFPF